MAEKIGSIYYDLDLDDRKFKDGLAGTKSAIGNFTKGLEDFGRRAAAIGVVGIAGVLGLKAGILETTKAADRAQAALIGLNSVASAFGQDADKAKVAAQELAQDGLMTISDAAAGLKNLLAGGFSLDQATKLMTRFKDSAAFGRQGALSFGQAIVGATEGIKNGNSILVDNAGVTKNLSVILQEAGLSAQDLMKATTDAGVREAIFNGIIKETNPQLGDAARLAETAAGAKAKLGVEVTKTKESIGAALNTALLPLIQALTPLITKLSEWINKNPQLVIAIVTFLAVGAVLATLLGTIAGAVFVLTAAFGSFASMIAGAVIVAISAVVAAAVYLKSNWADVRNFFTDLWNKIVSDFYAVGWRISGALSNVKSAITSPFQQAFDWIKDKVTGVVDALKRLNPFARHSPSLVDLVTKGTGVIQKRYSNMFDNLRYMASSAMPDMNMTVAPSMGSTMDSTGPTVVNIQAGAFMGTPGDAMAFSEMVKDNIDKLKIVRGGR